MKHYFCPIGSTEELIDYVTNQTGLSRCNLTNAKHHQRNENAVLLMFGFQTFDETICCIKSFSTNVKIEFPTLSHENK